MLNKLLKLKNKKGFTMIEMIVVLVIIAILAAISVPAMIGYVQQARDSQYIQEARVGFVAAQAVVTELTANGNTAAIAGLQSNPHNNPKFVSLIGAVTGTFSNVQTDAGGTVNGITYVRSDVSPTRTVVIAASGTSVN